MTRTLSRRPRSTDDEPTEEPRSRRGRSRDEDDEPRSRRGRSRADDEDDAPRGRRSRDDEPRDRSQRGTRTPAGSRGWSGYKTQRAESSDYAKTFKLPEQEEIIKILDDEPFFVYAEHWFDEIKGRKSYVCLGDGCPLCDIGDKPRVYALFNILDLTDPDNPKVVPWKVSQTTVDVLENYATDSKTSPLNRDDVYYSVHKTGGGKKGRVQVHVRPVKARDLEEDWDIVPFSEEELDEFLDSRHTEEAVLTFDSKKALQEIADDLD